jgi:peptidyl-prolyl cis-trans isomerase C
MPIRPRALVAAVVALSAHFAPALAQSEADDPVVATVDGTAIHRSEVEAAAQQLPEQYHQMPLEAIFPQLLEQVINMQLISGAAEAQDLEDDAEVQAALELARTEVLRNAYLTREVDEATTEEKLRARYEEKKAEPGFAKEEVHARHILVETQEEAEAAIEQLDEGADFATLAQELSTGPSGPNGGDLGYFTRDQMVPEFAEAAFALEPDQVSAPVQTQFGWHVIKVLDKRETEPTFEESQDEIRQEIARETVSALVEDLRADATIETFNMDGTPKTQE